MNPATILALIYTYRYPILVPVALLAGFPTGMVVGVAIRLGYLMLIPAYGCIMLGELIGDAAWYYIGYHWGGSFVRRYGRYFSLSEKTVAHAQELFKKYDQRILFSSKLTTGFGFAIPILFTAGLSRMSFWRYMRANLLGQFFWSGGLIAVGYFFGDTYLRVNSIFQKATTVTLFVLIVLAFFGFARFAWRKYI
ncbi:MAG TPA: DedA family protein [Candidatus Paceibacterota bacterium]|nr:DedA family protein [Candidatus Paceibacterota bacterium]